MGQTSSPDAGFDSPLGHAFYFLYQPIDGLSEMGYFAWLTIFLVLMRIAITFYNIPHDALGAELTDDYEERGSIFGYNLVAVAVVATLVLFIFNFLIFPTTPEYANGYLNESRYTLMASLGAVAIIISLLVCTLGTMDQRPYLHTVDVSKKFNYGIFFRELGMLTIYASYGILGIVGTYAYIYMSMSCPPNK